MEKQTAVDFVLNQLDLYLPILHKAGCEVEQIFTEAKAIEKQQIVDAGNTCVNKYIQGDIKLGVGIGEQYFESTYKTNL